MSTEAGAGDVLAFWQAAGPEKWFKKDPSFDLEIAQRFLAVWRAAASSRLSAWEETPEGSLALVIVLDQFPRNMFRADPRAYATDPLARSVADRAIARQYDTKLEPALRRFFYLPFMHSENLADQERCVRLAAGLGDDEFAKYAKRHADIIRRFGRFPHRHVTMGRTITPEEQAFLDEGGFAG